ncbi:MAG: AMIN domain-containing protein [Thioploca sp.]|nr:AMIN domain-containing protein [Thioploca sp.]
MQLLSALLLVMLSFSGLAKPVQITDVHLGKPTQPQTRLVFDLSAPVTHNIFTLNSPYRLVIDLKNTQWANKPKQFDNHPLITAIRTALRNKADLRVVLDLNQPIHTKSFLLKPDNHHGHQLIVEMNTLTRPSYAFSLEQPTLISKVNAQIASSEPINVPMQRVTTTTKPATTVTSQPKRDIIIAIDAGHGGIDPGAIGAKGTPEKEIVLAIAKELAILIMKEPGLRAVLIRNGDYFIKLRDRIELARQYQADLFISIHADAYLGNEVAQGSSVYMLSRQGVSSEAARWLANKENAADLIGGVSLSDKDELLASVLLDLSQASTLEASAHLGQKVLKALGQVSKNHFSQVQRAGFMVLRAPDIPSILVETGFISNPREEQKLSRSEYRHQIANAIFEGVQDYFSHYPHLSTLLASR